MRVNANAVLRSWMLLAAFGGSYAPGNTHSLIDSTAELSDIYVHIVSSAHCVKCMCMQCM